MKKIKFIGVVIVATLAIVALTLYLIGYFKPPKAGIFIQTQPGSTVYIDGIQVGHTPYEATRSQGEITVKLIPDSFDTPLAPFESKLNLTSGVRTIITRNFSQSSEGSSGTIVSFEKVGGKAAEIAVISNPDAAQLKIDGEARGFTPYKSSTYLAGDHTLTLQLAGYQEITIDVKTYPGYKLTAEVNLSPDAGATSPASPTPVPEQPKPQLKILTTPTGFLRVRSEPSTLAKEVGQVEPGEIYEILAEDAETGWFKIEFKKAEAGKEGQTGWISKQYAQKIEDNPATPTASPQATPRR